MALNRLLWFCLNQKTSMQENGVGCQISPNEGERIVFFRISPDEFRKHFSVPTDTELCDGIIFYRRSGETPKFIFVEFKSEDLSKAESQIVRTADLVRPQIPAILSKPDFRGLILLKSGVHSSRNRKDKRGRKIATSKAGFPVVQKSAAKHDTDLRTLRGVL